MKAVITREGREQLPPNVHKLDLDYGIVLLDKSGKEVLRVKVLYAPRGTTAHAVLHVNTKDGWGRRGYGKAGGYGYHKASAAIAEAISDAGFDLYGNVYYYPSPGETEDLTQRAHIGGVGDSAVDRALIAVAQCVSGKRTFTRVQVS